MSICQGSLYELLIVLCVKMISFYLFLIINLASGEVLKNMIDMSDILAEDYMPTSLLLLENTQKAIENLNESIRVPQSDANVDGSLYNAMKTMNYHRNMMNQYLCRSFVAEQVIADMSVPRVKRRMGHVTLGMGETNMGPKQMQRNVNSELIKDEGSSGYNNWLIKSTTLEDIYRHHGKAQNKIDIATTEEQDDVIKEDFDEEYNAPTNLLVYKSSTELPAKHRGQKREEVYYADGSGYDQGTGSGEYQHSEGAASYLYGRYGENSERYNAGGGYSNYPSGGQHVHYEYPQENDHLYHSSPPKYHIHEHKYQYSTKEKDLAELFDIALTALAYLAFGMFLVHVVMCILSLSNHNTTTISPLMPMSMSPSATGTGMTSMGTDGEGINNSGTTTSHSNDTNNGIGTNSKKERSTGVGEINIGSIVNGDTEGTIEEGFGMGTAADEASTIDDETSIDDRGDTFRFRFKRDIPTITNPNYQALNELARKVLVSIETVIVAQRDDGVCLRKNICQTTQWSRILKGRSRIILAFWSLGLSWLSGRLIKGVSPVISMTDALKASILGLGNADCNIIYQECNLNREVLKRYRRRRKRSNNKST